MSFKLLFLFLILINPSYAISLDDLEESDENLEASTSSGVEVEWSGLLDSRLAINGSDTNWADATGDYGGRGLSRYGSSRGGSGAGIGFHLAQFSLESAINVNDELGAHIQLNISDHKDDANAWGSFGVAEAYIHDSFDMGISTRIGFLIPPVSLEHPNVAWSTKYTITPSAINTWMGEEIRTLGAEAKYKLNDNIEFLGALFSHNDSIGTVLVYRGWAMHDYQGTYGSRLRWNQVPSGINQSNGWVEPFEEQDDRLGYYGKVSMFSNDRAYKLEAFYYDNRAKPSAFDTTNYGWDTQFSNISIDLQFSNGLQFLAQAMKGKTVMGPVDVVSADFSAYYAMLTYGHSHHRLTFRYDDFKVEDTNDASSNISDDNSSGHAFTLSYMYQKSANHLIGLETLVIKSKRNGNEGFGDKDPDDNLTQVMYRFTF